MKKKKKNVFIGVAWPYVNGNLHLGHLTGCLLPADIFARFHRFLGNRVLMVSGSDCHGTPITLEAEKRKISPQEIVNIYHPKHKEVFKIFGISFDIYTKTTTTNHKNIVQTFFLQMVKNGYIFKKNSYQYFSSSKGKFLPDRYVEGTCPYCHFSNARGDQCDRCGRVLEVGELIEPKSKISGEMVILKETEHYYFDLPSLVPFLEEYLAKKGRYWRVWVFKEAKEWLKKGLQPKCITRDIDWGIKIPVNLLPQDLRIKDASNKRFYVWFEAVIGYFSATIEWAKNTKKWCSFWDSKKNNIVHYYFIGKDNLVFHTLFWPAQLRAADNRLHLPDYVIVNQFLTLEGQPFSKSRGVFISAEEIGKKYDPEAVRFYLAFIMPENSDSNFSVKDFEEFNNNILVGTLGNFINRVWGLAKIIKKFTFDDLEKDILNRTKIFLKKTKSYLENCQFKLYTKEIIDFADFGNKYLTRKAPWDLEKKSFEYKKILTNTILMILAFAIVLEPLIPKKNGYLKKILGIKIEKWPENEIEFFKKIIPRIKIKFPKLLFKKI